MRQIEGISKLRMRWLSVSENKSTRITNLVYLLSLVVVTAELALLTSFSALLLYSHVLAISLDNAVRIGAVCNTSTRV